MGSELWALDAADQRSRDAICWPDDAAWPPVMAGWVMARPKTMAGGWFELSLAALKGRRADHRTAGSVRSAMQGGLMGRDRATVALMRCRTPTDTCRLAPGPR